MQGDLSPIIEDQNMNDPVGKFFSIDFFSFGLADNFVFIVDDIQKFHFYLTFPAFNFITVVAFAIVTAFDVTAF